MEIIITDTAKADIQFFLKSGQTGILKKIEKLLAAIQATPFTGIGKPEPLKHNYSGKWSRRIDGEHRLIYSVDGELIYIIYTRREAIINDPALTISFPHSTTTLTILLFLLPEKGSVINENTKS